MIWVDFAEMRRSRCDGLTWVGRVLDVDPGDLHGLFAGPRLRVQRALRDAARFDKVRWTRDERDPDLLIGQHADPL